MGLHRPQWSATSSRSVDLAATTIDTARVARARGDGDALDGHALLCRLKVAAVLGILEGRGEVNEEDWSLAGVIAAKSERTRVGVVETLQARCNGTSTWHAARPKVNGPSS